MVRFRSARAILGSIKTPLFYFTGRIALPINGSSSNINPYSAQQAKAKAAIVDGSARRRKVFAVVISVLLHLFAMWLILRHRIEPPPARRGDGDTVTALLMIPDSQSHSPLNAPPPAVSSPRRPAVRPIVKPLVRPLLRPIARPRARATLRPRALEARSVPRPSQNRSVPTPQPLIALDKSLPAAKPPEPSESLPADDFSARLAARQRQRAAEESQERAQQEQRGTPEQQANERGKQIALANIASQLRAAGLEKDDTGGLFQLQHVGPHNAEFLFRGWKKEARRNWSQQLDVEQGNESDIRIAVVKKMIEIIRQHTQADFTWDSHRLGRQIHLSARVEDSIGLQQFLLREFFPDFSAAVR